MALFVKKTGGNGAKKGAEKAVKSGRGFSRPPMARMMHIHEQIKAGKFPNCRKLAEQFEVSAKTIQRDIDFMRDQLTLPIDYNALKFGFYYTEAVSGFPSIEVSEGEIVALLVAQKALAHYRGTSFEKPLAAAFGKITTGLTDQIVFDGGSIDTAFSFREVGTSVADLEMFDKLSKAVLASREIRFEYFKLYGSEPELRRVQPYHLACIGNLWYLFGLDLERGETRTFALPRMTKAVETGASFTRPANFNLADHLGGSFGVFAGRGGKKIPIRIRFDAFAARLVSEREWHTSQKITRLPNGEIELSLELGSLEEIERWILSWGSRATVIEPKELVDRVGTTALAMARAHGAPEASQN